MKVIAGVMVGVFLLVGCSKAAAVSYMLEPTEVAPGENPVATLRNTGSMTIEYGNHFTLEIRVSDAWEPVEDDSLCAFTLEVYPLDPGESKSQEISACGPNGEDKILDVGTYRVTKDVRVPGNGEEDQIITSRATFRVVEP